MLKRLQLRNFTVFEKADFRFGDVNILVGENGAGKTHVLKVAYSVLAGGRPSSVAAEPTEVVLARKLLGVLRPDTLGHLVSRQSSIGTSEVRLAFSDARLGASFSLDRTARSELRVDGRLAVPDSPPVFFPTRELLTIAQSFVSLYETHRLPFEETWRDTCLLLQAPITRTPDALLLAPLEKALGGKVTTDAAGRFSVELASGAMEMHLVAEGLRKVAMLARLIGTGALRSDSALFWDEPEANLNPRLLRTIARTIMELAAGGVQVFLATHSLYLLRELYLLGEKDFERVKTRCFGLRPKRNGLVAMKQGDTIDQIGDIAALDEDVEQSDRYLQAHLTGTP